MLSDIDPGPGCPQTVRMIVEIPRGSVNKYEYDTHLGVFRLDRTLYSPMHYPTDYGFVPGTMAEDGDPIDILAMADEPTQQGCLIEVRPLGILEMVDSEQVDRKILAVPMRNPRYDQIAEIEGIAPHVRREIEHFFEIYKELEGKTVKLQGWRGIDQAYDAIRASRGRYLSQHK